MTRNKPTFESVLKDPYNFTYDDYRSLIGDDTAEKIYNHLYKKSPGDLKPHHLKAMQSYSRKNTTKHIFALHDGNQIETVLIHRRTGVTACLSTQVGCSVRCSFCESGANGILRNLKASEMVQQFLLSGLKTNRIVFMGIGEPLYNYEELIKTIHILRDRKGIDFPTEGMTISTVGPVDRLKMLKQEHLKIQLTLSLHATDQATRDLLIPGMSRFSINETLAEAMSYSKRHKRKLTIAYLLLPGINGNRKDLENLIRWFRGKSVRINILRYTGKETGQFRKASEKEMNLFHTALIQSGVEASVRNTMGEDIGAACGQLAINRIRHEDDSF